MAMRVREADADERERYDAYAASRGAHPCQSYAWCETARARGWKPARLLVEDEAGALAATASAITREVLGSRSVMEVPWGPVFAEGADGRQVLRALSQHAQRCGVVCLRLNPEVQAGCQLEDALAREGYRPVARAWHYHTTLRLDLTAHPETILAGMTPHHRRAIRRAERAGVEVSSAGAAEDFAAFLRLYAETYERRGIEARQPREFEAMRATSGLCRLFVAWLGGQAVHALMLFAFGSRLWFAFAGSDRTTPVPAGQLVHWRAIRWGQENGFREYDLGGLPEPGPAAEQLRGIDRFKRGFGGDEVRLVGEYEWFQNPAWAWALRGGMVARARLRSLRRGGASATESRAHASGGES